MFTSLRKSQFQQCHFNIYTSRIRLQKIKKNIIFNVVILSIKILRCNLRTRPVLKALVDVFLLVVFRRENWPDPSEPTFSRIVHRSVTQDPISGALEIKTNHNVHSLENLKVKTRAQWIVCKCIPYLAVLRRVNVKPGNPRLLVICVFFLKYVLLVEVV